LLVASLGGPVGINAFTATLGDRATRLDRIEPHLNESEPGDPRDTTLPGAMASDLSALVLGERLSARSRRQLIAWLIANRTGDARLRAGLPRNWRVGDKTGSGRHGTANDVAVIWPRGRAPLIVAAYLTGATIDSAARERVLAGVGQAIAQGFA
jgi:beta-lactamase class A